MVSPLRRLLACFTLCAVVVPAVALADRGDPQEKLNAADTARAKAMVLRKSDLGAAFKASPSGPFATGPYCKALDESDLVRTGKAVSPDFGTTSPRLTGLSSQAEIYESVADMNKAWKRGTSAAGEACALQSIRKDIPEQNFVSFARIALPRLAQRSVAWRLVWKSAGRRIFSDLVVMQHSRAYVSIAFVGVAAPMPRKDVVRVARAVAARMKTAMHGP